MQAAQLIIQHIWSSLALRKLQAAGLRLFDLYMRVFIVQETLSDNADHRQINSHASQVWPETDHNLAAHSQVSAPRSPFLLRLSLLLACLLNSRLTATSFYAISTASVKCTIQTIANLIFRSRALPAQLEQHCTDSVLQADAWNNEGQYAHSWSAPRKFKSTHSYST